MKISVDDKELFTLSEIQKNVIKSEINSSEFESDMKRRLQYILTHKYEQCFDTLKKQWIPKLESRMISVPTDPDELSKLIFSQPDYQDRKTKDDQQNMKYQMQRSSTFSVK